MSYIDLVSGNVGFGTTKPTNPLQVYGNQDVNGTLTVNGTLNVDGAVQTPGWTNSIWSASSNITPFYLSLVKAATQTISTGAYQRVTWTANTGASYSNLKPSTIGASNYWNTTANCFTPPVNGIYSVNFQIANTTGNLWLSKVSNATNAVNMGYGATNGNAAFVNTVIYMTTNESYYLWAATATAYTIAVTPTNGTSGGPFGEITLIQACG